MAVTRIESKSDAAMLILWAAIVLLAIVGMPFSYYLTSLLGAHDYFATLPENRLEFWNVSYTKVGVLAHCAVALGVLYLAYLPQTSEEESDDDLPEGDSSGDSSAEADE